MNPQEIKGKVIVKGAVYEVIGLLGKGKGGYSFLVKRDGILFVLKQIHHEKCDYFTFGDKLESELRDYKRLLEMEILVPKLVDVDYKEEILIKEYIDGPTIQECVKNKEMKSMYIEQVEKMQEKVRRYNLNLDYFPTNFVVSKDKIYYIDYECNEYMDKWNFENWGIQYWK